MIIDFHTHVFPGFVRENRGAFFPGEPAFEAMYRNSRSRCVGFEELVEGMDRDGVDISVFFGFPWRSRDLCRRHNDYVLEGAARHPERLRGFCCVPAERHWAAEEVRRCLDAGLGGVGELAFYDGDFTDELIESCRDVMMEAGSVPTIVHANEPVGPGYPGKAPVTLGGLYRFIKAYPENTMILAHWGGGLFFYSMMKKEVRESFSNVWFDTAASPYLYRPEIYRVAASTVGSEKIVLGSDYPLITPGRYLKEIASSGLSEVEISRICGGNGGGLLGLTGAELNCRAGSSPD